MLLVERGSRFAGLCCGACHASIRPGDRILLTYKQGEPARDPCALVRDHAGSGTAARSSPGCVGETCKDFFDAPDALRWEARLEASRWGAQAARVGARRKPYHVGLAAFVGGLLCCGAQQPATALAALVVGIGLALLRAPGLGLVAAALVICGSLVGGWRLHSIDAPQRSLHAGASLSARAYLLERPRFARFGSSAEVQLVSGAARGAHVLARVPTTLRWPYAVAPGVELDVAGLLERPRKSAGDSFDYPAYLRRRGIRFELALERLRATGARRGGLTGMVDSLRLRAERGLAAGLSTRNGDLLSGMVLGEDQRIGDDVKDDFRRSGLAHLLAVSGQNVMLLGALALPLLALAGLGVRARLAGVGALVALYVPLAGAGPSLQRAGAMGAAGLAAAAAARPASRWYALLLAARGHADREPARVGRPGLAALVRGGGRHRPAGRRDPPPARRPCRGMLAEGVAVTVAALLATAPLLAFQFGTVQLVALPANLLALPAVAPIMWLGMLQAALGGLGGPALALAAPLGWIDGLLLTYLRGVAGWFGDAPHGQLALPLRSPLQLALAYGLVAARACSRCETVMRTSAPRRLAGAAAWRRLPRGAQARARGLRSRAGRVRALAAHRSAGRPRARSRSRFSTSARATPR